MEGHILSVSMAGGDLSLIQHEWITLKECWYLGEVMLPHPNDKDSAIAKDMLLFPHNIFTKGTLVKGMGGSCRV